MFIELCDDGYCLRLPLMVGPYSKTEWGRVGALELELVCPSPQDVSYSRDRERCTYKAVKVHDTYERLSQAIAIGGTQTDEFLPDS